VTVRNFQANSFALFLEKISAFLQENYFYQSFLSTIKDATAIDRNYPAKTA